MVVRKDMSEIQFAVKRLGEEMSVPMQSSWTKMKIPLRFERRTKSSIHI